MPNLKMDPKLQEWITARKRHRLSHAHVQMARELGMNPTKLGKIDNHRQEPWKAPLPDYIEHVYEERFSRSRPIEVLSIEQIAERIQQKKKDRQEARRSSREAREPAEADECYSVAGTDSSSAPVSRASAAAATEA